MNPYRAVKKEELVKEKVGGRAKIGPFQESRCLGLPCILQQDSNRTDSSGLLTKELTSYLCENSFSKLEPSWVQRVDGGRGSGHRVAIILLRILVGLSWWSSD